MVAVKLLLLLFMGLGRKEANVHSLELLVLHPMKQEKQLMLSA
jgi:hypothetical protein